MLWPCRKRQGSRQTFFFLAAAAHTNSSERLLASPGRTPGQLQKERKKKVSLNC
jgi:hypothetical protein